MATTSLQQHAQSLRDACQRGDLDRVKACLREGTDINAQDPADQTTPLMAAAGQGQLKIVDHLIRQGASHDTRDHRDKTALSHAVSGGSVAVVRSLLRAGAQPDVIDQHGWTPLMHACDNGHLSITHSLIQHGVSLHPVGHLGENVRSLAQGSKNEALIALLEQAGARARVIRLRASTDPLLSMFDSDICRYLPDYTEVKEDSAVSRTVDLLTRMHVQSRDLGRHAYCVYAVEQCPNCATLYMNVYAYDAEDSHLEPPTSRTEIWRLNLRYADQLLRTLEQTAAADALQARHPALIDDIRRRMTQGMPANFFNHMVDTLVDQAIAEHDWARLQQELLRHPRPAVGLRALKGLLRLLSTSPTDEVIPRSRGSRPITRATRAQSVSFIQQHFPQIRAELDRRQPLEDWRMSSMYTSIVRDPDRYGLT